MLDQLLTRGRRTCLFTLLGLSRDGEDISSTKNNRSASVLLLISHRRARRRNTVRHTSSLWPWAVMMAVWSSAKKKRKPLIVEACHSYELCNLKRSLLNLRQHVDGSDCSCGEGAHQEAAAEDISPCLEGCLLIVTH